jgi:tRNA threonylcarbamoyladenosine biosynthesis protein TsaE
MRVHARTAEDTEALGGQLAGARPRGAAPLAVLYLTGELGAGKTTFARGFLRALGVTDPVRSPTYTLLELHAADALTVVHLDLYRLQHPLELESLGLRDWAGPAHLWLIEWPERAPQALPAPDLMVRFTVGNDGHDIALSGASAHGESWLARLA